MKLMRELFVPATLALAAFCAVLAWRQAMQGEMLWAGLMAACVAVNLYSAATVHGVNRRAR